MTVLLTFLMALTLCISRASCLNTSEAERILNNTINCHTIPLKMLHHPTMESIANMSSSTKACKGAISCEKTFHTAPFNKETNGLLIGAGCNYRVNVDDPWPEKPNCTAKAIEAQGEAFPKSMAVTCVCYTDYCNNQQWFDEEAMSILSKFEQD